MSANKWTPGPWKMSQTRPQEIDISSGAEPRLGYESWHGLAIVFGSDDDMASGQIVMEDNARLIAAAPDLAEALEEAMRVLNDLPSTNQEGTRTRNAWNNARAALAKARWPA